MQPRALIWFNQDLRTQDNLLLDWLVQYQHEAVGVVFIPEDVSAFQLEFFKQAFIDLKKKLEKARIQIFALKGNPEVDLVPWIIKNKVSNILTTKCFNTKDQAIFNAVQKKIAETTNANISCLDQRTLLSADDLPFNIFDLPNVFTHFRIKVEKDWKVRQPVETSLNSLTGFDPEIPNSAQIFSFEGPALALPFEFGRGESGAWDRIKEYLWDTQSLSNYKETRNGMLEKNDSSKLSPWLAQGCISARSIYYEVKKYEDKFGSNESTYWLIFELLWRDYFKFLSLKVGDQLFSVNGLGPKARDWSQKIETFRKWSDGLTGQDFVDANMIELSKTGWMSNRGRQNVASFLAKNLGVDWTLGAQYFERQLIDSDVESNWGNWQYLAGVGADPRDRVFNVERQAQMYDPNKEYRQKWLNLNSSRLDV